MGDIADMMINGDLDFYSGEYLGRGHGFPRTGNRSLPWEKDTPEEKKIRAIRKELGQLISKLEKDGSSKNVAVNEGRRQINLKYGKGWRIGDFKS